jgi:hypothetical protein
MAKEEKKEVREKCCKDCKSRNNRTNDYRLGDGGTGWCAPKKKHVARRADTCNEFNARDKQVNRPSRKMADAVEETAEEAKPETVEAKVEAAD